MQHDEDRDRGEDDDDKPVAVAVITPDGTYPDEFNYHRAYVSEIVEEILTKAAAKLHLTNTHEWVATVNNRPIDPKLSFSVNRLHGVVEIEWHKKEGGGGA